MWFEFLVVIALLAIFALQLVNLGKPRHVEYRDVFNAKKCCAKCEKYEAEKEREEKRKAEQHDREVSKTVDEWLRQYQDAERAILEGKQPSFDFEVTQSGLYRSKKYEVCVPVDSIESIEVEELGGTPYIGARNPFAPERVAVANKATVVITLRSGAVKRVECWPPKLDFLLQDMHRAWDIGRTKKE